jgi:hypothetical protein
MLTVSSTPIELRARITASGHRRFLFVVGAMRLNSV